jgi:Family of unknown function (DUF5519)
MGSAERIEAEVGGWPGVEVGPHRFGGVEFRFGRRELGHLHGDRFADLPVGRKTKDELIDSGRARPHHVLPDSGWVTVPMQSAEGERTVVELLRVAYERAVAQEQKSAARHAARRAEAR